MPTHFVVDAETQRMKTEQPEQEQLSNQMMEEKRERQRETEKNAKNLR